MVMTIAKITAGDGYTYLTRHTALGDPGTTAKQDATAYYTAQGNPPGRWTGRGAPLLGLAGREVTEQQMRSLFGLGEHPDAEEIIGAYIKATVRAGMTRRQLDGVRDAAMRQATLGRPFPGYQPLERFAARVSRRLGIIREQTGREPTQAEDRKVRAGEARRQRAAVAGFDLVFSPVKSAALLWALDERPRVREAIRAAHEQAMHEALTLVEDHAAFTRTGAGGIAQIATNGLTAAAFEHWDSRAGDPNLHTHVAVSAKVQGTDGKWRSLDARALYRITVAASECYNTAFETHLTASLGVTFTPRPDTTGGREPVREITGIPFGMIGHFSRRRAAIETRYAELVRDYRQQHGHDPPAAVTHQLARQANLDTRQGKKPPRSLAGKRTAWREELREAFGATAVARLMSAVPAAPRPARSPDHPAAPDLQNYAERTVATVAARRSAWTIWNIRAEAERLLRAEIPGLEPGQHRELADAITTLAISPQFSLSVEAPALLDEPPELRREDGEPVYTEHAATRFTSQPVLDAEQRLLNATRTPTVNGLSGPSVTAAIDGFEAITGTALDDGQRHLVTAFCCDERLLLAGIGPAGSGKTTAMRACAHVLRQHGRRLIPLATSAAAAHVLARELTVPADNLHKFLHEHTAGPFAARLRAGSSVPERARMFALHPGDVILVDEAGMAGTFPLDQLVQLAASRGATVRLLGDDRQLPAVESGGALRLVVSAPGTPELSVLYRFLDPEEAAATLQLRTGDGTAVDWYARSDRIRAGSKEHITEAAYDGWKADMLAGKVTLMAAAAGASVTGLSARARADRVLAGQVEPDGVILHDGNRAGTGDWIVTRHNDRRLTVLGGRDWVKNGDAWHVERRHADGSLAIRHLAHGGRVTLPAAYVRGNAELLYATTTHRAQGATVDTAHPLITAGMTRENLYVLASRAREKTTFYVATHDLPFDEDARVDRVRTDPRSYAAREILLNIVATEAAPMSATETIAAAQDEAASLATVVPRYLHAAHQDAESRYASAAVAALGDDRGRDLVADPAWGAVVRRLYDAEGDDWDPARLMSAVAGRRELDSAGSVAEVMAWRIDAYLTDNPRPSASDRPYEPAAIKRERLAEAAKAALGSHLSERARAEAAWPALLAALGRAEDAGCDPAGLLPAVTRARELRTARSVSEVLAWRISRHLAAHPAPGTAPAHAGPGSPAAAAASTSPARTRAPANPLADDLLPWVASPRQARDNAGSAALGRYLDEAAALITARVDDLASTAVRHRPPWLLPLGQPPADPGHERQWRRHVAIVAAYRDQYKITTSDPRQVLGPYPEPGHAGHKAYWHAAGSVLAARQFAGLDPATDTASADAAARARVAAGIYHALPAAERAAIAAEMAARLGPLWFGDPAAPDEDAATQPAHAATLTATLTGHGHLTSITEPASRQPALDEPLEAGLARRGPRLRPPRQPGQGAPARRPEPLIRPAPAPAQAPQQRR